MQILTRPPEGLPAPEGRAAHCRFGCFLVFFVGLYLPRRRFLFPTIAESFPQIGHFFAIIVFYGIMEFNHMQGVDFIFSIAILIMSVVIHEVSHGSVAYALGDPTAKNEGRLTLNPLKHLDLFGSLIVPFITYLAGGFIFGWAKPVPYNPYNLKNQKVGSGLIGAAGPLSNFLTAAVFGLIIRYGSLLSFLPNSFFQIATLIVLVNLILGTFNLVPVPPLDGSKILFAFLPYRWSKAELFLERYGFFLLLIFILFFFQYLLPVIAILFKLFTGLIM